MTMEVASVARFDLGLFAVMTMNHVRTSTIKEGSGGRLPPFCAGEGGYDRQGGYC